MRKGVVIVVCIEAWVSRYEILNTPIFLSSLFPSDCILAAAEDSVVFSAGAAAPKVNVGVVVDNLVGEDEPVDIVGALLPPAAAPNINMGGFTTPDADSGTVTAGVAGVTTAAAAAEKPVCDGGPAAAVGFEFVWIVVSWGQLNHIHLHTHTHVA